MDLMAGVKETWELPEVDVRTYSPLVLAYIGDAVYEVVVRSLLVGRGNAQPLGRAHNFGSKVEKL